MTTLLIDNVTPRIAYLATAGQTVFDVPFVFDDNADLKVYANNVLQTITTNYTVAGANSNDDNIRKITFTSGRALNDAIVITREEAIERTANFPSSGPLAITSLNAQLNRITRTLQRLLDQFNRTIRMQDGDSTAITALIPLPALRADKIVGFDSNGNLTVSGSITSAAGSAAAAAASAATASSAAGTATAAAAAAEAAYDSFDDRYLGAKAADPTLDNDGQALITGAAYFNTTSGLYRIWNGAAWVNAAATLSGVTASQITDSTATGRAVLTAANQAAARAAIDAAQTSHTHTAAQISNATATGISLMTAADAAAARTAIGVTAMTDFFAFYNFR